MPPNRTKKSAAAASDASSSTILPRPRGRPRKDAGNVSLSSTVGAPTPGRRPIASSSLYAGNVSLASTAGPSTPAVPKKRGRPSKAATAAAMTHPSMRALTSAASDISASRARGGRPPKSILANRTITSPNSSVSFSDHQREAPPSRVVLPASARQALASSSSSSAKQRGRPSASGAGAGSNRSKTARHSQPEQGSDSGSEVSLIDGASSDEDDSEDDGTLSQSDEDDEALSSADEDASSSAVRKVKSKKRKGWPSEKERLRKWRRLSVEERECVTSEGGLIWRTAIPLLNSMPKNIRSMVADSLTRALNRIDSKLESGLVPPLARIPLGTSAAVGVGGASATGRRDLASSMLSWRLEEEATLLRSESGPEGGAGGKNVDVMGVGMNGEIAELEQTLLPEAEQIVELSKTLQHQSTQLERAQELITRLKRDRRMIKTAGSTDYPGNLEANALLSVTNQKQALDGGLGGLLRFSSSGRK